MWRRLVNDRLALATAIVSVVGVLLCVGGFAAVYASGDGPQGRRVAGWLLMSAWSGSPYIGALAGACFFASRGRSPMLLMAGTTVVALLTAWAVIQIARNPSDGQAALAMVALPLLQWPAIALALVFAFVFRAKPA